MNYLNLANVLEWIRNAKDRGCSSAEAIEVVKAMLLAEIAEKLKK